MYSRVHFLALTRATIVHCCPSPHKLNLVQQHQSLSVEPAVRPRMVKHQPFTALFVFYHWTMAWALPTFLSHGASCFQNGIIWIFSIWSQGIIRFGDTHSIAVIIIAASTIKQIVNSSLFHEPLSLDNTTLPSLVVFHQQNGVTSGGHSCWVKQNCPKLSGMSMSISIYFIYQIVVHSLPEYCCVYQSLRGIGY